VTVRSIPAIFYSLPAVTQFEQDDININAWQNSFGMFPIEELQKYMHYILCANSVLRVLQPVALWEDSDVVKVYFLPFSGSKVHIFTLRMEHVPRNAG
jgi:hypothetical protein